MLLEFIIIEAGRPAFVKREAAKNTEEPATGAFVKAPMRGQVNSNQRPVQYCTQAKVEGARRRWPGERIAAG
jgi:hypothetical protein